MKNNQSLYNQIKRAVMPRLIYLMLFIIGSGSVVYLIAGQTQLANNHKNYIERLTTNLSTNTDNLISNIDNMSKNDLLVNGLIDFQMRDDYLPIFFQGLRVFKNKQMGVALFDFSGEIFLEKGWPSKKLLEFESSWQQIVFQQNSIYTHIDNKGVIVISPIFIAGSVEGALGSYLEDIESLIDIVFDQDLKQYIFDQYGKLLWASEIIEKDIDYQQLLDSLSLEYYQTFKHQNLTIVSSQAYSTVYKELLWLMPFFIFAVLGSLLSALLSVQLSANKASRTLKNMHDSIIDMSANKQKSADYFEHGEASELKNIRQSFTELLERVNNLSLSNDRVTNVINSLQSWLVVVSPKGEVILSNCKDAPLFKEKYDSSNLFFQEGISNVNKDGLYSFTTEEQDGYFKRTIEWSVAPFTDDNAKKLGYIFNGVDITLKLSLQKDVSLRQQAMDLSPAAISIADVSVPDTPLIYVNQAFCKLTGYAKSEVLGKNCKLLQGPATEQEQIEKIRQAIKEKASCQVILTNYKKNYEVFINSLSLQPVIEPDGSVNYFVGVQQDITTEKRTQEYLSQAKEQAEQTTRAQSRFFASINHELRTPINGINGMINALLNTELTQKQRKHAELAKTSANNLMLIVNDVLDYSKAESGQLLIEPVSFKLSEFIRELSEYYNLQCQDKGLKFVWTDIPNDSLFIYCDRLRLQQILDNLVNNAIKFTDTGEIKVITTIKELDNQVNSSPSLSKSLRIEFDVIDTGIGIATDQIQNVFKMFGQVKSSSKKMINGTGLGLNIAKQLVQLMKGELSVTSEIKKGSTFSFYVIVEKIQNGIDKEETSSKIDYDVLYFCPTHIPPNTSPVEKPKTPIVLVVEDNEINQAVVNASLPHAKKLVASNGNEALKILSKVKVDIDVILMDCQMPELDGWETTQLIRNGHVPDKYTDIPVIALTAYSTLEDQDKCRQAGMNDYLSKPFNPEQLNRKVDFWTLVRRQSK